MTISSMHDGSATEQVMQVLASSLNPLLARGVLRYALNRVGIDQEQLDRKGLEAGFIKEIEYGLKVMASEAEQEQCRLQLKKLVRTSTAPRETPQRPNDGSQRFVAVSSEEHIVRARNLAREIAREVGFGSTDQIKIATAVSEVSRNLFAYAGQGLVTCRVLAGSRRGIRVEASDRGPGIANIDKILAGEYESSTGMGLGLRGCKRLMDHFQVTTGTGSGTTITMEKYL